MSGGAARCEVRSAWGEAAGGPPLAAALRVVREEDEEEDEEGMGSREEDRGPGDGRPELVRLCRPRGGDQQASSCCLLEVSCPSHRLWLTAVSVESEARTVELYADGEYVGSARGQTLPGGPSHDNGEEVTLYTARISREYPSPSCEIKLMSLGDKECVRIRALTVWVCEPLHGTLTIPGLMPTVDMARVCSMVESMGMPLSPGAQSLMGLVQQHQQNQQVTAGNSLQTMLMAGLGAVPGAVDVASLLKLGTAASLVAQRPGHHGTLPITTAALSEDSVEPTVPSTGIAASAPVPQNAHQATAFLQNFLVSSTAGERRATTLEPMPGGTARGADTSSRQLHTEAEEGRPSKAHAPCKSPGCQDDSERSQGDTSSRGSSGKSSDARLSARPAPLLGEDFRTGGSANGGCGEDVHALEQLLLARVEESERRLMGFVELQLQALQAHVDAQFTAVRQLIESITLPRAARKIQGLESDSIVPNETSSEDCGTKLLPL